MNMDVLIYHENEVELISMMLVFSVVCYLSELQMLELISLKRDTSKP